MRVMDKPKRKSSRPRASAEHLETDRRTAQFLARRIAEVQEQLADLLPDLRAMEHYWEFEDVTFCMYRLQDVKKKYRKFAEDGVWDDK